MTTSRLLYSELRQHSAPLAEELDTIAREAMVLWQGQHLRTFTAHGEAHIRQVEDNLDALTRGLQASPHSLHPGEIFVLLAACYLHDIGMQLGERDARERHAQYAFELILNSHATHNSAERRVTLPINDRNARQAIASVARGHWTTFSVELLETETILENTRCRLRLLGLLLATANLLDLSPVRATYFRSIHRLDKLDATAQLHQTMHELVKGFQITAPDSTVSEELQYQLEWSDNSETTRAISDWVLHMFHAQWRTVAPLLLRASGGRVRWARPWAIERFRIPVGPGPELSANAATLLRAERAEQLRIDRDEFARSFKEALTNSEAALLRFPSDVAIDGRLVAEWCESHARLDPATLVARCDIQPTAALDQASIVAHVLEQWGEHLPVCSDNVAIQRLRQYVSTSSTRIATILVVGGAYDAGLIEPIVEATLLRPPTSGARVVLLLAPAAAGPNSLSGLGTIVSHGDAFAKLDVIHHLETHWGLDSTESEQVYSSMEQLGVAQTPARVYDYVRLHCGRAAAQVA